MRKSVLVEIISLLFVFLFVYTAVSKLMSIPTFVFAMGKSPLIQNYVKWLVWLVPGIELAVACSLLVPRLRMIGLYASFGLMVIFTAYIIAILKYSDKLPCSCGGVISSLGWKGHLLFNIFFLLLGLLAILLKVPPTNQVLPSPDTEDDKKITTKIA